MLYVVKNDAALLTRNTDLSVSKIAFCGTCVCLEKMSDIHKRVNTIQQKHILRGKICQATRLYLSIYTVT